MQAFVIHASPMSPDGYFVAYTIPGITSLDRTASMVILRGETDTEVRFPDGKTARVKATVATLALGPGVTVMLGDRAPRGVRVPGEDGEERAIGFEPPVED